jgi:hypothetical protein
VKRKEPLKLMPIEQFQKIVAAIAQVPKPTREEFVKLMAQPDLPKPKRKRIKPT